ncbi:MAG: phosphotransferase [Planctomycetes bacterium]|nr:phosphotransferase [Planctomycetota bacterium]
MNAPWQPDIAIDAALAAELVEAAWPALAPVRLAPMGVGWDNLALLVNETYVFRFPRRAVAIACLRAELTVLPRLPDDLGLAVPRPRFVAEPSARYPAPFAGYARLAGRCACSRALDEAARARAARPLGAFLRRLHATELDPRDAAEVPGDRIGRADLALRRGQLERYLDALVAAGEPLDRPRLAARADALAAAEPWAGPPRLVHGDLYPRHVLVDERGEPGGVLDWGDVHRGDPALDLSIAFTLLPAGARAAFWEAYGDPDPATRRRAAFRALYYGALLLAYGRDVGDRDLAEVGRRVLAEAAADA